jgi:hypothetical protein
MKVQKIAVGLAALGFVVLAYINFGLSGLAFALGAGLLWVMLHFTRMMAVLKRAARRPKGWVGSAVMLNSKLEHGMSMLQIVGLAGAIGQEASPLDVQQVEVWRWTDDGGSFVTVTLAHGKVTGFDLSRPTPSDAAT